MFKKLKNKFFSKKGIDPNNVFAQKFLIILDLEFSQNASIPQVKISEIEKIGHFLVFTSQEGELLTLNTNQVRGNIDCLGKFLRLNFFGQDEQFKAKSIYHNKIRNCLIIVYTNKSQNHNEMNVCEISPKNLKKYRKISLKNPLQSMFSTFFIKMFDNEYLSGDGFVEYDEFNNKIITKDAHNVYKIWEMSTYVLVFKISDSRISDVRESLGFLITISMNENLIKLTAYDINRGKELIYYDIKISQDHQIEILELFETTILIKQESFKPFLFNLESSDHHIIDNDDFSANSHFMYNYKAGVIIAFNESNVQLFKLSGECVKTIDRTVSPSVQDNILCSDNLRFTFVHFPHKFPSADLDTSFIMDNSKYPLNGISSKQSKRSRFFTRSVQKQIEVCSQTSIERFLKDSPSKSISRKNDFNDEEDIYLDSMNLETPKKAYDEKFKKKVDILSGEFELLDTLDFKMKKLVTFSTETSDFLAEKYSPQLLNDYLKYLERNNLIQDTMKCFIFDCKEYSLYVVTNRGKIIQFRL
jgi:hypothetical protein